MDTHSEPNPKFLIDRVGTMLVEAFVGNPRIQRAKFVFMCSFNQELYSKLIPNSRHRKVQEESNILYAVFLPFFGPFWSASLYSSY